MKYEYEALMQCIDQDISHSNLQDEKLDRFSNFYRNVEAIDQESARNTKSGGHKSCNENTGFPSMHDFHIQSLKF
jgi:hypothetical protein